MAELDSVAAVRGRLFAAIETVLAAGAVRHDLHRLGGFFAGLRLRYFGSRPLIEDDSTRSGETVLLNAQAGYRFSQDWALTVDAFNVLDRQDDDITYLYESQMAGEAAPVNDTHFHPVEPVSFRVAVTGRF